MMSTDIGSATLTIIPDFSGFDRRLDAGAAGSFTASGKRNGSRFGSAFRAAARVGIVAGLAATAGAIKLGADAIGEAREAQKVQRQTNAVLKSTGGIAKVSSRDVGKLANKLSYMAGIDDEIVQGGENVLLTFKDVRNEAGKGNKIFDRATKVVLNMSTALGTDLKNSNIQVGKALNDPIKGIGSLTRVGVTFTDQQKDQIKTLVESGDKLKAQKIILKELGSEFGGSARSQASASDRLKVAFGNVEETLGKGLLPVVQDFSRFLLREGIPKAREFAHWFKDEGAPNIGKFTDKIKPLAHDLLPKVADGFKSMRDFAKEALPFAEKIVDAFNNLPPGVKKGLFVAGGAAVAAKVLGGGSGGPRQTLIGGVRDATVRNLGESIASKIFKKIAQPGATPTRPLYVIDVGKAVGTGALGNGSKVFGALGKAGILGAFGVALAIYGPPAVKRFENSIQAAITQGSFQGGRPGGPDLTGGKKHPESSLTFQERFNGELDKTHNKIIANKQAMEEFGDSVRTRVPKTIETKFTLLGIDVANARINGMFDTFIARNNRLQAQFSGSESSTAQPPNHTPGRGTPATSGRSVTVNNTYNLNTIKDAEAQDLHKRQQIGMGGFG